MYKIKTEFINQILSYLGTRPYNEVVNLIQGFNDKDLFSEIIEEKKK